jgi:hypothetical protein
MLRGICVSSKEELKDRMSQYIDDMNETPAIFKWKYKMDKIAGGIVVDKDGGVLICKFGTVTTSILTKADRFSS